MHHDHQGILHALHGIDALGAAGFFLILSFSFTMSLHCVGMCGPLVCARLGRDASPVSASLWLYNLGRLASYTLAGLALGAVGRSLQDVMNDMGKVLAVIAATALILQGSFLVAGKSMISSALPVPRCIARIIKAVHQLPQNFQQFTCVLVTVLLPCMTLGAAFMAAFTASSAFGGAAAMLAFYLGTLPAMVVAPAMVGFVLRPTQKTWVYRIGGVCLILVGILTALRIWHV